MNTPETQSGGSLKPVGSVRIEALSAALQDCINLFNDADERPDHTSLVCTKERREMWQHVLTVHGSPNDQAHARREQPRT
jgi:hypothetical protein